MLQHTEWVWYSFVLDTKLNLFTCLFVFILLHKPVVSGGLWALGSASLVSLVPSHSTVPLAARAQFLFPTPSQELLSHFWNTRVILVLLNLNRMSYLPVLKPWEFPLAFCARKWFVWETGCGMKLMWHSDLSCAAAALVNVEKCRSGFITFEYQLILYAYWMTNW